MSYKLEIEEAIHSIGAVQAALECLNAALNSGGICPARSQNLIVMLDQRLDEVALTLMQISEGGTDGN